MHRRPLLDMLDRYEVAYSGESTRVGRIRSLVRARSDCFDRACLPGHITASAWIVSHDCTRILLTHHRKLGRWLQLGGHADGDPDVLEVALREAREESGMQAFEWLPGVPAAALLPLDIDVHGIPARSREPAHDHYDIRFLLRAAPGQTLQMSDESNDLAWFECGALGPLDPDGSLLRLERKARRWLASTS